MFTVQPYTSREAEACGQVRLFCGKGVLCGMVKTLLLCKLVGRDSEGLGFKHL